MSRRSTGRGRRRRSRRSRRSTGRGRSRRSSSRIRKGVKEGGEH